MPCTALKLNKEGVEYKIKFITQQQPTYLEILVYYCDDKFIPIGIPEHNASEKLEEDYHKELRQESSKKGDFVKEQSTNIEWNPDYIKPIENEAI